MALHLPLLIWVSPSFPVGAFAYSHGIEWAHEAGDVTDAASLKAWLEDLLEHGAARNDAILFGEAYRATLAGERPRLAESAELAMALANSAERRLETVTQGDAFVTAIAKAWPCEAVSVLKDAVPGSVAYPVAVGVACAGHGIPLDEALNAFVLGFVANLISAAIRLGVVGQTDGQRVTAALVPAVQRLASDARDATLDDLGGAAFRSDLAALRHETQYTRLFRS
jgi:urease accessory protein